MFKLNGLLVIAWAGSVLSKFIYAFIGFSALKDRPVQENGSLIAIMSILGIFTTLGGTFLIRRLNSAQPLPLFLVEMFGGTKLSGLSTQDGACVSLYLMGIGMIETTALFGLAGFLNTGKIPFFVGMLVLSLVGWAMSYPRRQHDTSGQHPKDPVR